MTEHPEKRVYTEVDRARIEKYLDQDVSWFEPMEMEDVLNETYGSDVIEGLMKEWPEPKYRSYADGFSVCSRCGGAVGNMKQHTQRHWVEAAQKRVGSLMAHLGDQAFADAVERRLASIEKDLDAIDGDLIEHSNIIEALVRRATGTLA